ncbi:uncharacterized protein [Montipora capricornis]|uniref:uncharacterized protein n=1 Tax=Montipora capricornis TaxID=246305 RepID=UPI0035F11148
MNFCCIVILLTIQGLAQRCCEGQSIDLLSQKRPWNKEDGWEENGGLSSSEHDDVSGFESGQSANEDERIKVRVQLPPRIPRTYATKTFVTSGDGEGWGGSSEDGGKDSNSYGDKHYERSGDADFESTINFAKVGDAIDVMKKLKKAKSDQDFANKLKSGARVVMHSIVDDLINKTGGAIAKKAEDILSKNKDQKDTVETGNPRINNQSFMSSIPWQTHAVHEHVNDSTVKEASLNNTTRNRMTEHKKSPKINNSSSVDKPVKESDLSRKNRDGVTFLKTPMINAKKVQRILDEERMNDVMQRKRRLPQVTKHENKNGRMENHATKLSDGVDSASNPGIHGRSKLHRTITTFRGTSFTSPKSIQENKKEDSFPINENFHLEHVANKTTRKANNMKDKAETLEELKINFIEKENKTHSGPSENHTSPRRYFNVVRQSRKKSYRNNMADPKYTKSSKNGTLIAVKRLQKVVLRLQNMNSNKKDRQHFNYRTLKQASRSSLNTPGSFEKIVVHLSGEDEFSKENKMDSSVNKANLEANHKGNISKENIDGAKNTDNLSWQNEHKKAKYWESLLSRKEKTQTKVEPSKHFLDKEKEKSNSSKGIVKNGKSRVNNLQITDEAHSSGRGLIENLEYGSGNAAHGLEDESDQLRQREGDQKNASIIDRVSDLTNKHKGSGVHEFSISPKNNDNAHEETIRLQSDVTQKHKGVLIIGPQSYDSLKILSVTGQHKKQDHTLKVLSQKRQRHSAKRVSEELSQAMLHNPKHVRATHKAGRARNALVKMSKETPNVPNAVQERNKEVQTRSHITVERNTAREISDRSDKAIKLQKKSSHNRKKQKTRKTEHKELSKHKQGDTLTSRIPPASLLTTSKDDGVYRIRDIIQGPRKESSVMRLKNTNDRTNQTFYNLNKKIDKLQNEITVLETAVADVATRLRTVEQKTEKPSTASSTFLHTPEVFNPHQPSDINNPKQTSEYVEKDVHAGLPISPHRYHSQRIVIPISSLYRDDANTPFSSTHELGVVKELQDNILPEEKFHDVKHVTLPLSTGSATSSETHASLRPIVNIIVPNNKDDLLSSRVACIPKCQNGGICLNGNICRCPTFFSGDRCEKFSVYELLALPKPRDTHYRTRKIQRIALSEIPNQQELDGTLRLTAVTPAFANNDFSLKQEIEPPEALVVKKQPIELTSPSNNVNNEGISRGRQLVLEI